MKRLFFTTILSCLSLLAATAATPTTAATPELVRGGAFKDLILPMPIYDGLESEGIWGAESVKPRDKDNGMEDNEWSYWGGNPILCSDGLYHIALCRWHSSTGHNGWHKSEVAHCVSERATGPYRVTRTIVDLGHNPEVVVLADSTYVLHTNNYKVYSTKDMAAEWSHIGNLTMDSRGFRVSNALGSNLTIAHRPDGSFIMMQKDGDILYSREDILGPYKMCSINNYKFNGGYAEDPAIWRSRHQYHCIYNNAMMKESIYMRSLDGLDWKVTPGRAYDRTSTRYVDGTRTIWGKFERPKVIQDSYGRAEYLALGVIDVEDKNLDVAGDEHSSKHLILPLQKERLISIVAPSKITASTKRIEVRVEAEDGFSPVRELRLETLRFGSDSVVDFGGGCCVVSSRSEGEDLILTFEGESGLNGSDYDFKLLGEDCEGELVLGYALLEQGLELSAKLIALPQTINAQGCVEGVIENLGFESSKPMKASVVEHSRDGRRTVAKLKIPSLQPYEEFSYSFKSKVVGSREYEVLFDGQRSYLGEWTMVDESDASVSFSGAWTSRVGVGYYMGQEMTTTSVGSSAKFTFEGSKARIYGSLHRGNGTFDIYLDGELLKSVLLSFGEEFGVIFETESLSSGEHTLELVSTNEKLATLDAFAYAQ